MRVCPKCSLCVWKQENKHLDITIKKHHDACVRTTATLDDDIAVKLQELAHRQRQPFKVVLNQVIRVGLGESPQRYEVEPFVVRALPCGLKAGFDDRRFNQLVDELDAAATAEKLRLGR
jgi:hypothetical protein